MSTTQTPAVFAAAGATFDVLNSNNTLLRDLYTYPPSSPEPESSSANSSEVNSAGMQSMSSNATGNSTDAVCSKNAFLLPLQLGQNDFNIAVTAPEPADQVSKKQLCMLASFVCCDALAHSAPVGKPHIEGHVACQSAFM